ncbi:TraR/DksA family transcriptional regulator [Albidovulum sp.]
MSAPDTTALAARYRPRIEAELAELDAASRATGADRRPVALDQQSVGRLSRMDAMQGQAMAAALEARRGQRRQALGAALRRLQEEEFGLCAECGEFIGLGRLDIDPTVLRCRACAGQ